MDYPYQTAFEADLKRRGLAPTTIRGYHDNLTRFFAFLADRLGDEPRVAAVTEADLRAYFDYRQQTGGITLATYNKLLSYLNRYFRYLLLHQLITTYPTLPLHGALPQVEQPVRLDWLARLDQILADDHLHLYTRLTLFLTSRGFQVSEFLAPGFATTFATLTPASPAEAAFLRQFAAFHAPLAARQACADPFLKLRVNHDNPRLSNAGLHKFLKPDEDYLGFRLGPRFLFQAFVFYTIDHNPTLSAQQLQAKLRLDPAALNYYQRKRLTLKSQGKLG